MTARVRVYTSREREGRLETDSIPQHCAKPPCVSLCPRDPGPGLTLGSSCTVGGFCRVCLYDHVTQEINSTSMVAPSVKARLVESSWWMALG